ncbi:MAG: hypothetical protein ABSF44_08065 [Candidatus Bathyarchaeia archaeon]
MTAGARPNRDGCNEGAVAVGDDGKTMTETELATYTSPLAASQATPKDRFRH